MLSPTTGVSFPPTAESGVVLPPPHDKDDKDDKDGDVNDKDVDVDPIFGFPTPSKLAEFVARKEGGSGGGRGGGGGEGEIGSQLPAPRDDGEDRFR